MFPFRNIKHLSCRSCYIVVTVLSHTVADAIAGLPISTRIIIRIFISSVHRFCAGEFSD